MSSYLAAPEWTASVPWIDRPDADIGAYVRGLPRSEQDWAEHHLTTWRRDGIIVFEKAVDGATIDALLNDIDYLIRHHRDFELGVELQGRQYPRIAEVDEVALSEPGTKFNNLHTISQAALRACLNASAMRFMRHVFADAPALIQTLTFFKGSQQPVHLDYPYVRIQTKIAQLTASWLALEDISPDAGALAYWPGAHDVTRLGLFDWGGGSILHEPDSTRTPAEFSAYLQTRLDGMGLRKQAFTPKRGDVLIWHALMPHEGTTIHDQSLSRKSLVTHFTSSSAYPEHFKKPDAEAKGHVTELNGGRYFHEVWLEKQAQLPSAGAPAKVRRPPLRAILDRVATGFGRR